MDTLSHAAWGYVVLHKRPTRLAVAGLLAGAAPDLLWFIPSKIEQIARHGWAGLTIGREPGIWRADGPPLPPDLVDAYFRYYVWTHSLVVLAALALLLWLLGRRSWWPLAIPYALHIVMDIPTHERYQTRPFYPLSEWQTDGISWADPRIFWPNLLALAAALAWIWYKRHVRLNRVRRQLDRTLTR